MAGGWREAAKIRGKGKRAEREGETRKRSKNQKATANDSCLNINNITITIISDPIISYLLLLSSIYLPLITHEG